MTKDPKVFLCHILESIVQIERYMGEKNKEEFLASPQIQDAVMGRLEIIGEASKNLPVALRDQYAAIPWNEITGMRDVLIHGYFGVDTELVWRTVQKDLTVFKAHVEEIISSLS